MTTGRRSRSGKGDTKVLPVAASRSTCSHVIACGRVYNSFSGATVARCARRGARAARVGGEELDAQLTCAALRVGVWGAWGAITVAGGHLR